MGDCTRSLADAASGVASKRWLPRAWSGGSVDDRTRAGAILRQAAVWRIAWSPRSCKGGTRFILSDMPPLQEAFRARLKERAGEPDSRISPVRTCMRTSIRDNVGSRRLIGMTIGTSFHGRGRRNSRGCAGCSTRSRRRVPMASSPVRAWRCRQRASSTTRAGHPIVDGVERNAEARRTFAHRGTVHKHHIHSRLMKLVGVLPHRDRETRSF